jgi:hypothetical protein
METEARGSGTPRIVRVRSCRKASFVIADMPVSISQGQLY